MKLTKADKEYLLSNGNDEMDILQIQEAAGKTKYTFCPVVDGEEGSGKRISRDRAITLLGRERFLSGLSRSAFHWSASQSCPDGEVYFDSSKYFREE